jgi:hypothetical protein
MEKLADELYEKSLAIRIEQALEYAELLKELVKAKPVKKFHRKEVAMSKKKPMKPKGGKGGKGC